MGSYNYKRLVPADCPVCGKPEGAFTCSTAWLPFEGMACSEECGQAARKALVKLHHEPVYRRTMDEMCQLKGQLRAMELRAIGSLVLRKKDTKP